MKLSKIPNLGAMLTAAVLAVIVGAASILSGGSEAQAQIGSDATGITLDTSDIASVDALELKRDVRMVDVSFNIGEIETARTESTFSAFTTIVVTKEFLVTDTYDLRE